MLQVTNLETLLLIPAVHSDGMSDADWDWECKRMFIHTVNTRKFVTGQISPQDYEDSIADLGFDPYELEEGWAQGDSLLV